MEPKPKARQAIDIGGTKFTGVHVDHYVALGRYLSQDVDPLRTVLDRGPYPLGA